jgi:hypothetical protein
MAGPFGSAWRRYRERFRLQRIDEPVQRERERIRDRFRRQRIDDPVQDRRTRRRSCGT